MGVGGQCHAPATLPPGKTRYPMHRSLGGPRADMDSAENLVTTGIRFPERPACSKPLYRPRYPGPRITGMVFIKPAVKVFKIGNISVVPTTVM